MISNIFRYIFSLLIITMVSLPSFAQTKDKGESKNFKITKNLDIFNSIFKELEMYYVDTIPTEKVVKTGIDAMLRQLDPYTTYMSEEEKEEFTIQVTGEYAGIGALIQQRGDTIFISDPYEGMPAQQADLRPGDAIIEIDGESMIKKESSFVSNKLKGQANTPLTVKILRKGSHEIIQKDLIRKKIQMKAVPYYGMVSDSIGYIYLTAFTDKSASEVKNAIIDLKKNPNFKSLIFDLRNNGGGDLEEAIQIVNFFVPKGVEILQTRGKLKNWDRTYKATQEPILPDMPLVVMVNRGSASASEIVTGALQDLDRAVIIGERTFGKGLVQTTRPLSYNGLVKITSAKYYIPSGRLIQAIDYSNRNPDGSVGRIPDSLTHVFNTANGRIVKDGGGILPDIITEQPRYSNMSYYLVRDNYFFDFANDYANTHESIGSVEDFKLSDEEYDKFKKFVISKNFTYDRQSDKALKDLKQLAEFEGYSEDAKAEFEALEAKLSHNVERDLDKFRSELSQILSQEIVKRYYFEKGEIKQTLKVDKELDKALEILNNKAQYKEILSPKADIKADEKKNKKESLSYNPYFIPLEEIFIHSNNVYMS